MENDATRTLFEQFDQVIMDSVAVYPDAILVGAVAAAKYIGPHNHPRVTRDVDLLINETDFTNFLADTIPGDTLILLETYFDDSDSCNHSLKHKTTDIYVDLLSVESKPVRKKTIRYILENREKTTNLMKVGNTAVHVLKPEFLVALKLSRCTKSPKSERGRCDRTDITNLLKKLWADEVSLDDNTVHEFINQNETECYAGILADVASQIRNSNE